MRLDELDNWSALGWAVLVSGIVLGIAMGLGRLVTGRMLSDKAVSAHLQLAVGINLLALIGLLLGTAAVPYPLAIVSAPAVAVVIWYLRTPSNFGTKSFKATRWRSVGFSGYVAVPLVISLGPALTFPSGWDELMYHVELPRRWMNDGWLSIQTDLPYSALPSLSEILFWLAAPVEHLITPRLLSWVVWANGFCLLRETLRHMAGTAITTVWLSALILSPIVLMIGANCYVESFVWMDVAALGYLLFVRPEGSAPSEPAGNSDKRLALAGIVLGGAIATKVTCVGLLLAPITVWVVIHRCSPALRKQTIQCVIIALAFAIPFYLRAWFLCGNPVFPYFADLFTRNPVDLEISKFHHALAVGNFGIGGWPGWLMAPFAISFASEVYDGSFGLQWLIFLAITAWGLRWTAKWNERRLIVAAASLGVMLLTIWSVSSQQARFGISSLMFIAIASARALDGFQGSRPTKESDRPKHRRSSGKSLLPGAQRSRNSTTRVAQFARNQRKNFVLAVVVVTSIFSVPWTHLGYYLDSWLCFAKIRTPMAYLRDGVGDSFLELSLFLSQHVQEADKVATLFEHRLAYLPKHTQIATPFFQSQYFTGPLDDSTAEDIVQEFRQHGVKFLVLTTHAMGPDIASQHLQEQQKWYQNVDQAIAKGYVRIIWRSEFHAVGQLD